MFGLFYPYGIILQALAILHFVRRRPDTYWIWIILMFGGVGALIYMALEVVEHAPSARSWKQELLSGLVDAQLGETAGRILGAIHEFTAAGREDLGGLAERRVFVQLRVDPFYRRALCELALQDFPAAAADLQQVIAREPKYDYQRAAGLTAHALAKLGQREKAEALFAHVTKTSTLSETEYNYACFLVDEGRASEAREWAERILRKKATMPDYIRRRERPLFRKARALLKRLPA